MWARIIAVLSKILTWILPAIPALFSAGKEIAKFTLTKGSVLTTFVTVGTSAVIIMYNKLEEYSTSIIDNLSKVQSFLQQLFSAIEMSELAKNILYYSSIDILFQYLILFLSVFFSVALFLLISILVTLSTLAISALTAKMFTKIYDKISKNINVEFS